MYSSSALLSIENACLSPISGMIGVLVCRLAGNRVGLLTTEASGAEAVEFCKLFLKLL